MFTNAGMNQWKDIILGNKQPEPRRRADSQKCLRVSGKHNDLEEVGRDTYHHTMFEMLGNWSFGDYFKEGAIDYAWEYLVDVLHLDPKDLYVTVFEGSPEENIPHDSEAEKYWRKHLPADHIINGNKHDNFWEMGDTGPCGPCSEIHVDSRSDEEKAQLPGRELVNKDHPQVIEMCIRDSNSLIANLIQSTGVPLQDHTGTVPILFLRFKRRYSTEEKAQEYPDRACSGAQTMTSAKSETMSTKARIPGE